MRKTKIGDILFGLLLSGFILSMLTGCGQAERASPAQERVVFNGPESKDCTSYIIPDGVTEIGYNAFYGCNSLTSIEIPDSVTKIGAGAFEGCSSLTGIEIPDSVTMICGSAFANCSSLTSIEIPDSVTTIYNNAFEGCSSLNSVTLPQNLNIFLSQVFGSRYTDIQFVYKDENGSIIMTGDITVENVSDMEASESKTETNVDNNDVHMVEAVMEASESKTETNVDNNDAHTVETVFVVGSSIESIKSVCGLVAPVETSVRACHWDSYGEHPYDVVFDYGSEYQAYVDACDWSLVFDAEYYMNEFPMLALQYHYDEEELLFHFQTVGIHEGRQGSADFNVYAYAINNDDGLLGAFDDDYEGYYLYYMLNYDTEEGTDTVTCANQANIRNQYALDLTALQQAEWDAVYEDRKAVNAGDVSIAAELCAFANYRAYLNAHDGYKAHDWAIENLDLFQQYYDIMGGIGAAENTVTMHSNCASGKLCQINYHDSKPHYDAMVNPKYDEIGISNVCNGYTTSSQFDFYINLK